MKHGNKRSRRLFLLLCLTTLLAACGGTPTPGAEPTRQPPTAESPDATSTDAATATATTTVPTAEAATATPSPAPTAAPLVQPATPSPPVVSRCQGLGGTLEVQVLVGPAEAVGLEPVSVGDVPSPQTARPPRRNHVIDCTCAWGLRQVPNQDAVPSVRLMEMSLRQRSGNRIGVVANPSQSHRLGEGTTTVGPERRSENPHRRTDPRGGSGAGRYRSPIHPRRTMRRHALRGRCPSPGPMDSRKGSHHSNHPHTNRPPIPRGSQPCPMHRRG
jgi:hypothetical protein